MTPQSATNTSLTVRKTLECTPEEAFDAWTNPDLFQQWFMGTVRDWTYELDIQVGGKFMIMMKHEGETLPHSGEYRLLDRPRKLEFTWNSKYAGDHDSTVTIEFKPNGDKTDLLLTHVGVPEEFVKGHTEGWTSFVDKMAAWLTR
jgi:uncharacterized protein YndB with AHSA1/START domain